MIPVRHGYTRLETDAELIQRLRGIGIIPINHRGATLDSLAESNGIQRRIVEGT
jgi:hypothetical protein